MRYRDKARGGFVWDQTGDAIVKITPPHPCCHDLTCSVRARSHRLGWGSELFKMVPPCGVMVSARSCQRGRGHPGGGGHTPFPELLECRVFPECERPPTWSFLLSLPPQSPDHSLTLPSCVQLPQTPVWGSWERGSFAPPTLQGSWSQAFAGTVVWVFLYLDLPDTDFSPGPAASLPVAASRPPSAFPWTHGMSNSVL